MENLSGDITATPAQSTSPTAATIPRPRSAAAYGANNISFGAAAGNGAGQTIAIVDAYNDPDIASDLTAV